MANQWFKFYGGEYLSDSKIGRLSGAERSCWLTLLCMASMTDNGVIEFLSVEDLLLKSGITWNPYNEGDWEKCQNILIKFTEMKMIKMDTSKSLIEITNWSKRQEHNLTPAERMAKMRAKNKEKVDIVTKGVTTSVTNVTLEENRIEENRIEENIDKGTASSAKVEKPKSTFSSEGAMIIKAFEEIDIKNKRYYSNTTQRSACDFLINEYGLDEVLELIPKLKDTNKTSFYQITTPYDMVEKITKVFNDVQRKKLEVKSKERGYV